MPRIKQKKKRSSRRTDETCFVLMPFDEPFARYYQNIFVPAIHEVGLEPVKADSLFRPTPIMSDIWHFARAARVLLADLTKKNANVFYELGLAHALGKPVIMVAAAIEDVPFDLRGLRVLIYDKEIENWGADLKKRIVKALRETLEDIAGAVAPMFLERVKTPHAEDPLLSTLRGIESNITALRSELQYERRRTELVRETDHVLRTTLTPREEKVIRMRFGLDDDIEHGLGRIAEAFEVTEDEMKQIEAEALRKLRHPRESNATELKRSGLLRSRPRR